MERLTSQNYRDNLANKIKSSPKNERRAILEISKSNPQYWQARGEKRALREIETRSKDGKEVLIKQKTLYHGSANHDIKKFNHAEEDTVGSGIYFTSEAKDAIGYARRRARTRHSEPVIYETIVNNVKLADLRSDENVKDMLGEYRVILVNLAKPQSENWIRQGSLMRAIDSIDKIIKGELNAGNFGQNVVYSNTKEFSEFLKAKGYDGLVTFEGGEGEDISVHDSYVIFDPDKIKISNEHKIV